jgi:hypothetical protein
VMVYSILQARRCLHDGLLNTTGKEIFHTQLRVQVLVIVEDPTVTEMQNGNNSTVPIF